MAKLAAKACEDSSWTVFFVLMNRLDFSAGPHGFAQCAKPSFEIAMHLTKRYGKLPVTKSQLARGGD